MNKDTQDIKALEAEAPSARGSRWTALASIMAMAISLVLLQQLASGAPGGRPFQSVGWLFGPAPVSAPQ